MSHLTASYPAVFLQFWRYSAHQHPVIKDKRISPIRLHFTLRFTFSYITIDWPAVAISAENGCKPFISFGQIDQSPSSSGHHLSPAWRAVAWRLALTHVCQGCLGDWLAHGNCGMEHPSCKGDATSRLSKHLVHPKSRYLTAARRLLSYVAYNYYDYLYWEHG